MGWLEDAMKKAKELEQQSKSSNDDDILNLNNDSDKELLSSELAKIYENATLREINKAIEYGIEKLGKTCKKTDFLKTVRIKLED